MHVSRVQSLKVSRASSIAAAAILSLSAAGCAHAPGAAPATPPAVSSPTHSSTSSAALGAVSMNGPLSPTQRRWVDSTLASLSPRDRIAQMVTVWVLGDYTNAQDTAYLKIRDWIEREHVGGIVMSLGSPIEVAAKVNAMQRMSRIPLLISSDVEPGLGRLEGGVFVPQLWSAGSATVLPTNMAIGAGGREQDAYDAGRITGQESRAIGIHLAFAPVVDVNNNPSNPVINVRSFGEDATSVARLSAAFVRGVQDAGVAATAKHFPGHGDTDTDSHLALPVVRSDRTRMNEVELVPFRAAIAAGLAGVMTAHIALPAVEQDGTPATLSPRIMTDLLRDTLRFGGLTVTDAMTMQGVGKGYTTEISSVLAVQAGDDILLMPSDVRRAVDAVLAAVNDGRVAQSRIDASVRRILELKVRTGAISRPIVSLDSLREVVGSPRNLQTAHGIAERAITLVRDSANLVPTGTGRSFAVISYAPETEPVAMQSFVAELRSGARSVSTMRVSQRSSAGELDSLAQTAMKADRIVVTTYTRTFEGSGRLAIPAHVAAVINRLAATGKLIVVSGGNPYVIKQFPAVGTYMVTYGRGEALERAAARALLGRAAISGRSPITLPGYFQRGDGISRSALASNGGND
jgi:beta-N-acetylhexosaminidase